MNDVGNGPLMFFTQDHRDCDALWAAIEDAVSTGDPEAARGAWQTFREAMHSHFAMEEEVLFPALEDATGMVGGPTEIMRQEHQQMRMVLQQMGDEVDQGNFEGLLDHGDTLLMLTQQHNLKEENILYPMAEQHLSGQWEALAPKVQERQRKP